jgi:Fibronectin type III domain
VAIRRFVLRSAINPSDTTPPSTPTGMVVSDITNETLRITWPPSTDNRSVKGYEIEKDGVVQAGIVGPPTVVISGLSPGNSYNFRIRAVDSSDNRSSWSANVGGTIPPLDGGTFEPNFPVVGGYYINAANWSNSANDSKLAPLALVVYDHYYNTQSSFGRSASAAMAATKALTPAGVGATPIHTIYIIQESTFADDAPWYTPVINKINAENWWMRVTWSGGAGARVTNWYGGGNHTPNMSKWAHDNRKDSNGKSWIDWHAEYAKTINVDGGTYEGQNITPNPNLDAFFLDNSFYESRDNGDYDQDNVTENYTDADMRLSMQEGNVVYAAKVRAMLPDFPILGNMNFFEASGGDIYNQSFTPNYTPLGNMYQLWDGGLGVEYLTSDASEPYAYEYQERNSGLVGFWAMRNSIRYQHGAVRDPRKLIFSLRDVYHDGSEADNQRLRFGACAIMVMSNGMIDDRGALSANSAYNALYTNNGAGHGWLGQPVSETPNWTPDGQGVYVREFTNGFAAVNPRNNGSRTFTVGVNTRNIVTNVSYSAGSSIPIGDRDGVLLVKT